MQEDVVVLMAPALEGSDAFSKRFAPLGPSAVQDLLTALIKDAVVMAGYLVRTDVWFACAVDDHLTASLMPPDMNVLHTRAVSHADRLIEIADAMLSKGHRQVVMVAADSPVIDNKYMEMGLDVLVGADAVIGPSTGGGYLLAGVTKAIPRLFLDIEMGTTDVLRQTVMRAHELDLNMKVLPTRRGADSLDDLFNSQAAGEMRYAYNTAAFLDRVKSSGA